MRAKILSSALVVVFTAVILAGATLALFTSEAAVANNTLAAGKLELTVENPEVRNFVIDNIYPGQEFALSEIEITNSGSLPYYLKAVISETEAIAGPGGGYLPTAVNVTADLSGSGETAFYSATLADLLGEDLAWQKNEQFLVIEPGSTVSFRLDGQFDLSAGNEYQESAWEGAITFTAVQSDGQDPAAGNLNWGNSSLEEIIIDVDEEPAAPVQPVLINAARERTAFSASRTDSGSAANLAEVEPDNQYATWQVNVGGSGLSEWIKYDFGTGKTVLEYALRAIHTAGHRSPRSWHLEGSTDDQNWTVLDSQTGIAFLNFEEKRFVINSELVGNYRYYRIQISESNQGDRLALDLFKLFAAN